jgi:outer membrane protein assembly factor BamB
MHWQEQLGRVKFHASAVVAEGRVYLTSDDGITYVLKAGDEYELLAKNPLGEKVFASPAFSDGDILIRGAKHLWCLADKK